MQLLCELLKRVNEFFVRLVLILLKVINFLFKELFVYVIFLLIFLLLNNKELKFDFGVFLVFLDFLLLKEGRGVNILQVGVGELNVVKLKNCFLVLMFFGVFKNLLILKCGLCDELRIIFLQVGEFNCLFVIFVLVMSGV